MIGCGRLDFGLSAPGDAGPGPSDAPPVPTSICGVHRYPMAAVPRLADLAIAPIAEGYLALWVDTHAASDGGGAVIGPDLQLSRTGTVPGVTDTALGGVADAGQNLVLVTSNGTDESLWTIDRVSGAATLQARMTDRVMGHDPFPSDVGQKDRAFVAAQSDRLEISLVSSDGTANLDGASQFAASGPISEFACTDGPDHSHCVWADQPPGGAAECIITDVDYRGSIAPVVGSHFSIAPGCSQIRNASGPPAADSMIVVWVDVNGAVQAHYAVSTGDVTATIGLHGSAPKVQFDGTRFWIAWLDGGGELRLTSFELATGVLVQYELPGWQPSGPEAFELVTRGNETALVLLSSNGLDFLTICT
jgi:hypothetical protein